MNFSTILNAKALPQNRNSSKAKGSTLTREQELEILRRIQMIAKLLDNCFVVPGTNYRVGWDGIIGLVPGIGDVATAGISLYLVHLGRQLQMPQHVIRKMLINIAIDASSGLLPVVGDLFDVAWKANAKNAKLLERHLLERHESKVFETTFES